jgi:hypothetical protein
MVRWVGVGRWWVSGSMSDFILGLFLNGLYLKLFQFSSTQFHFSQKVNILIVLLVILIKNREN